MMIVGRNGVSTSFRKPSPVEIESGVKDLAGRVESAIEQIGRDIPLSAATRDQIMALLIGEVLTDLGIRNEEQLDLPLEAAQ